MNNELACAIEDAKRRCDPEGESNVAQLNIPTR
jgi:hypothetical protein